MIRGYFDLRRLHFVIIAEKDRILEEKFQKLKDIYSKLREEHINLIRKVYTHM